MTTIQAILFGIMIALTPSMILLALMFLNDGGEME